MLENWSDKVTIYWDFIQGPFSLSANLLLIYIILKYTPESTKTYASIILNISVADCMSLIGVFLSSARVIPRDNEMFLIFRGACIYCFNNNFELKSKICLFFYSIRVQFYILNQFILIFSYIYRMLIVTHPLKRIDRKKVVYVGLISYSSCHFCFFIFVCFNAFQPMDVIDRAISKYEPDIVRSGATYNGVIDLNDPFNAFFSLLSIYTPLFVIIIAVFCHWRIISFSKKYQYSESVQKLHRSLKMVFSAQTIGPLLSFFTSVLYLLANSQMGASPDTITILENSMSRPAIVMTIVNPIVTLYFITPYRVVVQRWLSIYPTNVIRAPLPSSTTTTQPIIAL